MFDEKNEKWIIIYRILTICLFLFYIVFGFIAGYGDSSKDFLDVDLGGGDDGFLDFIVWVLLCGFIGSIRLTTNMIFIQFFNNINIIKEKVGSK